METRLKSMYEYFLSLICDSESGIGNKYFGICYKLNFKLDSIENMRIITEKMEDEGYKNPVILFFKLLNE